MKPSTFFVIIFCLGYLNIIFCESKQSWIQVPVIYDSDVADEKWLDCRNFQTPEKHHASFIREKGWVCYEDCETICSCSLRSIMSILNENYGKSLSDAYETVKKKDKKDPWTYETDLAFQDLISKIKTKLDTQEFE